MDENQKAIVLIPGQIPQLVGRWRLGEFFQALDMARLWMENQEMQISPPLQPAEAEAQAGTPENK